MANVNIWINGRFVESRDAKVSVFDRGLLYGDGVFDTMRSYGGSVFKKAEHLARLFGSSKAIGMKIPYSKEALAKAIRSGLSINKLKDASVRITITRGEGTFTLSGDAVDERPNVIITIKRFNGYPARLYFRGITACISDIIVNERSPLAGIKSLNFLEHILARAGVKEKGFDEAILVNSKGNIAEAATSNVFIMKTGRLMTPSPDQGVLPGITRKTVIGIARKFGMKTAECAITRDMLMHADEVFLTNSLVELLSVVKIGPAVIGDGLPGPAVKLLHAAYRKMV